MNKERDSYAVLLRKVNAFCSLLNSIKKAIAVPSISEEIPRILRACTLRKFPAKSEKTAFVHFTQNAIKSNYSLILIKGQEIRQTI